MKQYTLVIADSSEDFRRAMQLEFESCCHVFCCSTGMETLETIHERHPDVLVLDLMLPELDGLSILNCLTATGDCPEILAMTAYSSIYILQMAEILGVSYVLEKPCRVLRAAELVRILLQKRTLGSHENQFIRISGLLLRLGFTAKLRGYGYLRDAVLSYAEDPQQSILKELYPSVAANYGVTAEDVEHSIRSAAMDAWSHCSRATWGIFFPLKENQTAVRPSNAALIQGLSRCLNSFQEKTAVNMI